MILFEFEFLICFTKPKNIDEKVSKKKSHKVNKSQIKGNQKPSNTEKEYKQKLPAITLNALDSCHIEYCILDKVLPVVEINVTTWDAGTYIFVEDYCREVGTVIINDVVWINFTMCHKIAEFTHEEVITFKNNPIVFTIFQNQTKYIPASSDENWQKQFLINKKSADATHSDRKWFSELKESNFPFGADRHDVMVRGTNCEINEHSTESSIKMLLQTLPLKDAIRNKIQVINQRLKDQSQDTTKKCDRIRKNKKGPKSGNNNKKINIDSKQLSKAGEVAKLYLRSEELIAGKSDVFGEQHTPGSTMKYIGVFANSSQILTEKQNDLFLPLIVSIKSIEDLPLTFLEKMNLKRIYAQYEFGNVLQVTETEKFLLDEKDVFIEDTRVFFLSEPEETKQLEGIRPSMLKLQEALSTRMMVVRLYAEKHEVEPPIKASLFGQHLFDDFISTPGHEIFLNYKSLMKKEPAFLGSACFKLIQLLSGFSVIETSSVLTSAPLSTWDPTRDGEIFMEEMWKHEERESLLNKLSPRGQIPDSVLLETFTRITVSVSSPCVLKHLSLKDQLCVRSIYHRIAVVFKNQKFAFDVLKRVKSLNDIILEPLLELDSHENSFMRYEEDGYGSKPKSHLHKSLLDAFKELSDHPLSESSVDNIITGFFLDNDQECIMVLEGSPKSFFNINEMLTSMILPKDGKIMYDSTLFFTQRLYNNFCPLMNIFYIKLKTPLDIILRNEFHYLTQNASAESVQALLRLDMLRRSPTLDCITFNQLFPSYKQLINFNISFGVTFNPDGSFTLSVNDN